MWARAQLPAEVLDDPRVCPPTAAGQLPLFEAPRTLSFADARRIRDRVLAGQAEAGPVLAAYAAQHGHRDQWRQEAGRYCGWRSRRAMPTARPSSMTR